MERLTKTRRKQGMGPQYTLTEFARAQSVKPGVMRLLVQADPNAPKPTDTDFRNGEQIRHRYALADLRKWWGSHG